MALTATQVATCFDALLAAAPACAMLMRLRDSGVEVECLSSPHLEARGLETFGELEQADGKAYSKAASWGARLPKSGDACEAKRGDDWLAVRVVEVRTMANGILAITYAAESAK